MPKPLELREDDIYQDEHAAIQAVAKGEASDYQQALCLEVIIKKLSLAFDLQYVPGSETGSAFLSGRSYVGQRITRLINTKVTDSPAPPEIGGEG